MAKPAARIAFLQFGFAVALLAVIGRSAQVQIAQRERWAGEAERQRTVRAVLPARRGSLYDRNGVPLAITQEFYHIGVAPNELEDIRTSFLLLIRNLGVPAAALNREFQMRKRWIYLHGPFNATQVQPLRRVPGIHITGTFERFYPSRELARPIIGGLDPDGPAGAAGLELSLDSILTGLPGEAVFLKDRAGRRYESPSRVVREPVAGNDVTLTIDAELQEIAERGLDDALEETRADAGDVVFLDPASGELLALASRQTASRGLPRASVFTDPFEPGSTAKLFTAAALLMLGRVDSTDAVSGENGSWSMPVNSSGRTRTIHDSHVSKGMLTLAEAVRVSSNIAMAKFSVRLKPEEQFEMLRDFGFGTPTATEFPSESRGRLDRPDTWQPMYTRPSMAMGYNFAVTPVQLAAAYAAIANDGVLLAPTLVKEIRDPSGALLYRHRPEPVRRVVTTEVAARLQDFLRAAVGAGGTGTRGQLANYSLMGKTGTAIRFEDGHYVNDEHVGSFAALFPADDPQLVVIVKIDNPKGKYYGGLIAAPVTRTMLQQALASRRVAIDRGRLVQQDSVADPEPVVDEAPTRKPAVVIPWPYRPEAPSTALLPVPAVAGRTVREAALALHRRGFRVSLQGLGHVVRTEPEAGESARPGTSVTVVAE